jgi:transposase
VFKPYSVNQMMLLPPSLEELIPQNHMVRVVNDLLDKLDLDRFICRYEGGGASSYHPMMMLKVLIYAYTQRIYTSRQIAKALRENVQFMWISGGNRPDFRTINRFRSGMLRDSIDSIFVSMVEMLIASGHVKLENYFLDGTKIEGNANRYSFVWKKASEKYSARLQKQVRELLKRINDVNDDENTKYGDRDLEEVGEDSEVTPEMLERAVEELNRRLKEEPANRELKKAEKKIRTDYLPRAEKYEEQKGIFGERNSYSKTDEDATFMRMKEDHMRNGQLKPGYNVQIGTENRFVLNYSIHHNTNDTQTLIGHMEKLKSSLGLMPGNLVADAGYGSEENYRYLDENCIGKYVKYNYFGAEQKRSFKKRIFDVANLPYDKSNDTYTCPNGKKIVFHHKENYKTLTGYISDCRIYECEDCTGCALREGCHKSVHNRRIKIRPVLNAYRQEVKELLTSVEGKKLRSRRGIEVETVFAQIKQNMGFRRFLLRGTDKVKVEWGLLCIAYNVMKVAAVT